MLIIARPARLLECLEFDPEDFYNQMVDMEGEVRTMQMIRRMNQSGTQWQQQQQQQPPLVEAPSLSVQDTGQFYLPPPPPSFSVGCTGRGICHSTFTMISSRTRSLQL